MTPQLLNDEQCDLSWQRCRNCSMMSSTIQVGDDAQSKSVMMTQLLNDEQHNKSWR
jgi:hypothetical protein